MARARIRDFQGAVQAAFESLSEDDQYDVREAMKRSLLALFEASKGEWVRGVDIICKDCGQKRLYDIPVEVPDVLTQMKAFEVAQTLGWGKPAEPERRVSITVTTREELASLPDEELELVAGSVDAEWAPLELEAAS